MKVCTKCLKEKYDWEFYFNRRMASGRFNECMECVKEYNRQRYVNKVRRVGKNDDRAVEGK